jgi:hypothetical protein
MAARRLSCFCIHLYAVLSRFLSVNRALKRAIISDRRLLEKRLSLKRNPRALYRFASKNLKSSGDIGPLTSDDNSTLTDPLDKANLFAKTFQRAYSSSSHLLPVPHLPPHSGPSLDYIMFAPHDVYKYILRLPNRCSTSPDGINYALLRMVALPISVPVSIMFNKFLLMGKIPPIWGFAHIRPVYKRKGSPHFSRVLSPNKSYLFSFQTYGKDHRKQNLRVSQ